jgi:hypothetical protein
VVLLKKKTRLLEESLDQEKELIRMKGEKIRLEQLRNEDRVYIEKERKRVNLYKRGKDLLGTIEEWR